MQQQAQMILSALDGRSVRLAIVSLASAATALFVLFLRAQGFHINQIIGFTGFAICLLGLIFSAIAINIVDRRREHEEEHARPRAAVKRVTPRRAAR